MIKIIVFLLMGLNLIADVSVKSEESTEYYKKNKVALVTELSTFIVNFKDEEIIILDHKKRVYTTAMIETFIDLLHSQISEMDDKKKKMDKVLDSATFIENDRVSGYACKIFVATLENGDKLESCISMDLQKKISSTLGRVSAKLLEGELKAFKEDSGYVKFDKVYKGYPLYTTLTKGEDEKVLNKVLKIETKNISQSKFAIPDFYKKISLSEYMENAGL